MTQACFVLGIDGRDLSSGLSGDGCCPPSICNINPCQLACQFVQLLPSGPLWDGQKRGAVRALTNCGDDAPCITSQCGVMAAAAANKAASLFSAIAGPLWISLRESSPETAYDTIDQWLERLGWQDCFGETCLANSCDGSLPEGPFIRVTNGLAEPAREGFQIPGTGSVQIAQYVEPDYPDDLLMATKRGIVLALTRLNLRPVITLDALNFILEPLGAYLEPTGPTQNPWDEPGDRPATRKVMPCETSVIECDDCPSGSVMAPTEPCIRWAPEIRLSLKPMHQTVRVVRPLTIFQCSQRDRKSTSCGTEFCQTIPGFVFDQYSGRNIFPGVLAAFCIANSAISQAANVTIEHHGFTYRRNPP